MHSITVIIGQTALALLFKTKEHAEIADNILSGRSAAGGQISVEDDFGQKLVANTQNLAGYLYEDLDSSKLAHVERALHQTRTQNLAQKTAEADPSLRLASRMGPAMISSMPGFNGRG